MNIIRYHSTLNDFVPISFSNLIDRFFSDPIARTGGSAYSFVPRVDILEDEKGYEIQFALPGVDKEGIKIDLTDDQLTVSGERKMPQERKEDNFRTVETLYGTFSRSITLPENVDGQNISAQYVNGILVLNVPKDEKKVLKQTIKVN